MDVGGGHGELLSRCMSYAGPSCQGLLLDREYVINRYAVQWKNGQKEPRAGPSKTLLADAMQA